VRGSLYLVGKLGSPGRLNAVAAGQLIHMLDQISNRRFLVDTGASYSILPHCSSLPASGPKLYGPVGQPIPCWGDRLVKLKFQDQDFSWKFLLVDVAFPILGVDFLRAHKLLIDPEGHALLDSTGRRLASQLLRSPPTATVVVGFVQPYKPMAESSSFSAHTAGETSAGAASTGAASAGAASAGAASTGVASARPLSAAGERAASAAADVKLPSGLSAAALSAAKLAGKLNPAQMKAAYSKVQ
jgi:hypothetical protein